MKKRIESILLALALVIGLVPMIAAPAYAADGANIDERMFPDPVFREYVKAFDQNHDDFLTLAELDAVDRIICREMGIQDFAGIENFTSVTYLDISNNELEDRSMSFLAFSELEYLDCAYCNLTELDISGSPKLQVVNANTNELECIDVSQNPQLRKLYVGGNVVSELDLSNNPLLTELNCSYNLLSQLNVSMLPELEELLCAHNDIAMLNVSHNPKLRQLFAYENPFRILDVTNNPQLQELSLWNTSVRTLDLRNNPLIVDAYLYGTKEEYGTGGHSYISENLLRRFFVDDKVELLLPDPLPEKLTDGEPVPQDQIVEELTLLVTVPEPGDPYDLRENRYTAVEGEAFEIISAEWTLDWGIDEDGPLTTFKNGNAYRVSVLLEVRPGYQISDGITVRLNTGLIMSVERYEKTMIQVTTEPYIVGEIEQWKPVWDIFDDVPEQSYYTEAVEWAYYHEPQITTGTSDTTFEPYNPVERANAVTFLWRAKGCPKPKGTGEKFSDVDYSKWYGDAVQWAVEEGITNGTGGGKFSPWLPVAQDQMITLIWRTLGEPGEKGTGSTWYADSENWARSHKLMDGTGKAYNHGDDCPRADVVYYLFKELAR